MNWRRFFRREEADAEQREEIESYLDLTAQEYIERGMEPPAARAAARRKLGNATLIVEEVYQMNTVTFIEGALRDVRHALRMIRSNPGFSSATILSLALGIGAATSIFTLAHAVLLKSLPVARPDELYRVGKGARCCYLAGYSQDGVFSRLIRLVQVLKGQHQGLCRTGGFPGSRSAVRRSAGGQLRSCANLRRRIRFWQLLRDVRNRCVCRTHPYRQGRPSRRTAGRLDELSVMAGKIWVGSVGNRQHLQCR
jgi:hypothetical protein